MTPDPHWLNALQNKRNEMRGHFQALGINPEGYYRGSFRRFDNLKALIAYELTDALWLEESA